jgi:uncharacterized protein YjbI with pentapeptide repeats
MINPYNTNNDAKETHVFKPLTRNTQSNRDNLDLSTTETKHTNLRDSAAKLVKITNPNNVKELFNDKNRDSEGKLNISNLDLSDVDLRNIDDLNQVNFKNVKFDNTNLSSLEFDKVNFENCRFEKTNLGSTFFKKSSFKNCSFDLTNFKNSEFQQSSFIDNKATNPINFNKVTFFRDNIFSGNNFSESNFDSAKFFGVKFQNNDLSYSDFKGITKFSGNFFIKTNLEGSYWSDSEPKDHISKAELFKILAKQDTIENLDLSGLDLTDMDLSDKKFKAVDLNGTDFTNSNLSSAKFLDCNLKIANFTEANLTGAGFKNSDLSGSNLNKAKLNQSFIEDSNLSNTDLTAANLNNSRLIGADLEKTIVHKVNFENCLLHNIENGYDTIPKINTIDFLTNNKVKLFNNLNFLEKDIYDRAQQNKLDFKTKLNLIFGLPRNKDTINQIFKLLTPPEGSLKIVHPIRNKEIKKLSHDHIYEFKPSEFKHLDFERFKDSNSQTASKIAIHTELRIGLDEDNIPINIHDNSRRVSDVSKIGSDDMLVLKQSDPDSENISKINLISSQPKPTTVYDENDCAVKGRLGYVIASELHKPQTYLEYTDNEGNKFKSQITFDNKTNKPVLNFKAVKESSAKIDPQYVKNLENNLNKLVFSKEPDNLSVINKEFDKIPFSF